MTGLANTIRRADKTLEERGLPSDSFFEVWFPDGSMTSEKDVSWSAMCEERRAKYFGETKTIFVSILPIERIRMRHGDLVADITVPYDAAVYQAVRSETVLMNGKRTDNVVGRSIGIVVDGEVIEEQFLNGIENCVFGRKK